MMVTAMLLNALIVLEEVEVPARSSASSSACSLWAASARVVMSRTRRATLARRAEATRCRRFESSAPLFVLEYNIGSEWSFVCLRWQVAPL